MEACQKTFISSTNWTDRIGPAAAIATIKIYEKENADKHIIKMGEAIKRICKNCAQNNNIKIRVSGLPSLCAFDVETENSDYSIQH